MFPTLERVFQGRLVIFFGRSGRRVHQTPFNLNIHEKEVAQGHGPYADGERGNGIKEREDLHSSSS